MFLNPGERYLQTNYSVVYTYSIGGPGGQGTRLAIYLGDYYAALVGDDRDLIGFDPRGIGRTQ